MNKLRSVQVAASSNRGSGRVVVGSANWAMQIHIVTQDYFEAREWPRSPAACSCRRNSMVSPRSR